MLAKASFATLVPIKKMDRAIKFYTDVLGGKLNMRAEGEVNDTWASLSIGKNDFWLVKPEKFEKRDLAYTTFIVKKIKETVNDLKKAGVKFDPAEKWGPKDKVEGNVTYGEWGASAFFKDSEGNLIMLWQDS
ncbi:MAG: VOC family protein [Thaumarchaeota archaeon]|nr:VOC family protein [Nitrososphaerota archaeon]